MQLYSAAQTMFGLPRFSIVFFRADGLADPSG